MWGEAASGQTRKLRSLEVGTARLRAGRCVGAPRKGHRRKRGDPGPVQKFCSRTSRVLTGVKAGVRLSPQLHPADGLRRPEAHRGW